MLLRYLEKHGYPQLAASLRVLPDPGERHRRAAEALLRQDLVLPVSADLQENEVVLHFLFGSSSDVVFRPVRVHRGDVAVLLAYVAGLVEKRSLERLVGALTFEWHPPAGARPEDHLLRYTQLGASAPRVREGLSLREAADALSQGESVIFVAGATRCLRLDTEGGERRGVSEPDTESVVRGPREGFTEDIVVNTALIRRKIRSPRLRVETLRFGNVTRTRVAILYVAGVVSPDLLAEVRRRLQGVQIDGVLESGYLEEFIEDTPWTVFPLIKHTERPDVVAADLLEGRVAILTDGTPFALLVPTVFPEMLQAPEDYYERYPAAGAIRLLRWIYLLVALLGPSFYIAITTFHQEMLPTPLLLTIMRARERIPFPAVVEALLMEVAFEALREAGLRLPRMVGQSVSIVGALVIGEAAVRAGIVSAPMVIVVSLTGIASFLLPRFNAALAVRLLRFPMMLLAGTLGAYGIFIGVMAILIHMARLRSFGVPYLAPLAPLSVDEQKDVVFRMPWWRMKRRPGILAPRDVRRSPGGKPPAYSRM